MRQAAKSTGVRATGSASDSSALTLCVGATQLPPGLVAATRQRFQRLITEDDGACAIHAVFGADTPRGVRCANAREVLANVLGRTAGELRANARDGGLLHEFAAALWEDALKPQAKIAAGRDGGRHALSPEARRIWRNIAHGAPDLQAACMTAVMEEGFAYDAFEVKRVAIVEAFKPLCCPELREVFLRPLLSTLGIEEEYMQEGAAAAGCPRGRSKADAMYGDSAVPSVFKLGYGQDLPHTR